MTKSKICAAIAAACLILAALITEFGIYWVVTAVGVIAYVIAFAISVSILREATTNE